MGAGKPVAAPPHRAFKARRGGPEVGGGSKPDGFEGQLTARERSVVRLLLSGASVADIADALAVSRRVAEGHIYRIYAKLGISRRADLKTIYRASAPGRRIPGAGQGWPTTRAADIIGPCYDTRGLMDWLGVTKKVLEKRRNTFRLLAIRQEEKWVYPAWQFLPGSRETLPGLTSVLEQLSAGTGDRWTWALWLCGCVPDQLDGKPAWKWLADGGAIGAVLGLAEEDAASWAAV